MDLITPGKFYGLVSYLGPPKLLRGNYVPNGSDRKIEDDIRSAFGAKAVIVKTSEISDIVISGHIYQGVYIDIAFGRKRQGLTQDIIDLYDSCYNEDASFKPQFRHARCFFEGQKPLGPQEYDYLIMFLSALWRRSSFKVEIDNLKVNLTAIKNDTEFEKFVNHVRNWGVNISYTS